MALALESRIEVVTGTVDAGAKKFSVIKNRTPECGQAAGSEQGSAYRWIV